MAPDTAERRLAAIVFTDIVGYTALTARDEEAGRRARDRHETVVRPLVERYHGRWIEATGDESLSSFPSALDAVSCALAIQESLREDPELKLRIGVHLGDVVFEGGRVFGDGVNVASRVRPLAEPGGICVSDEVQHSLRGRTDLEFAPLGEQELKNVGRPVAVYAVGRPGTVSVTPRPATLVRARRWGHYAVPAVAVLLVAVVGWWIRAQWLATPGPIRSIAVLPLENLSGDPEQEYFADGMTEALISNVARIRSLRVISRTSVMQYKGARRPLPEIGRELDVDAIIEGSVLRAGNRVRIVAQLIHAPADRHLWAGSYERPLRDVLSLQRELARAIAREIEIELAPREQSEFEAVRPVKPAAYEAYLKGRYFWAKRTEPDLERALTHFERAIELDPESPLGYAGLAFVYDMQTHRGIIPPMEAIRLISGNLRKALALDDSLAEVHTSLGDLRWWDWDWPGVEQAYLRAIDLNPSFATAHNWYGHYLVSTRRFEEGLEEIERARRLDPLSPATNSSSCWVHMLARQYDRAMEHCLSALQLDPDFLDAVENLGLIYVAQERYENATRELKRAVELSEGGDNQIQSLAYAYARAGDTTEASRLLNELLRRSEQRYVNPASIALVYAGLKDQDNFFEWMEKAYQARSGSLYWVQVWFPYDEFRSDPRFDDLLRRIGFPES